MEDWNELGRTLDAMVASGNTEVREDGEWLADLGRFRCEVQHAGNTPLVHLWSETGNLTRRVLRVRELKDDAVILEVQRFGRKKPVRLEIVRTESARPPGRVAREQFRGWLRRVLCEQFPDAIIEGLTAAPDLEHSFSGVYTRGRMREGDRTWALMAASGEEDAAAIDGILAIGILWLDCARSRADLRAVAGLRLFLPEGKGRPVCERILGLGRAARTEVFEFSEPDGRMRKLDTADAGNLESKLRPLRDLELIRTAARVAFEQRRWYGAAAPHVQEAMTVRASGGSDEALLCYRGLEFARWTGEGIFFGLGNEREPLTPAAEPRLERLLAQLEFHRSPVAKATNHRLYRAAPEKWLESLVLNDPAKLDAQLDPAFLYSQVPALAAGDRGVIDLLGVTRRGRLVVIELKASEDIQLPIQAVDYWLRVRRHLQEGDFPRLGYFKGVELDSQPPLVWLVAPGLRFHPATDILLKSLAPEISIMRIGLSESWRRGIRVVLRQ